MTDQHTVYNSRMFCTRWNGLEKGSIFDDALDDKEYEGNLIYLLNSGSEFIRNNSKVRFVKKAQYRVDKPDYAERAVTEALVNALIHRDYIVLGSEIHIDMFDDRVEITSPGGMFGGGSIQEYDIYSIRSMRRNPVIADLFHRMKYMERRGSGLRKIVSETEKLPGYTEAYKPEFSSTATDFRVILKNVNYNLEGDAHQVIHQVTHQVIELSTVSKQILTFCTTPKSKKELAVFCGFKDLRNFILNKQRSRALGRINIVLILCLFCIDVPILIRPSAITIVCVSDPICVTIVIISVCCFFYSNGTVTALEFMLFQLVSGIIIFVIPGTI